MSLGEFIVGFAAGAMLLGLLYASFRSDILDARDTPSFNDILDALKHGKPVSSQWKRVDDQNRGRYAVLAFCFIGLSILVFAHRWLAWFIDQL